MRDLRVVGVNSNIEATMSANVRKLVGRLNATSMRMPDGRPRKHTTVAGSRLDKAQLMALGADSRDSRESNLQLIVGVESITRVHGSQTQSYNQDALTAIDIAGALGMCQNGLAREVFCAVWWPSGNSIVPQTAAAFIKAYMSAEQRQAAAA